MKKLQEAIYFKRIDLNELFWAKDRKGFGFVSLSDFERGLKLSPIIWSTNELEEIKSSAPKDPLGNVYYKDLQKDLNRTLIRQTAKKPELESVVYEKVASAVNEFIMQFPSNTLTFDDFRLIIRKTWLMIPIKELKEIWEVLPHDKYTLANWARTHAVVVNTFEIPEATENKESLPRLMVRLKEIALLYGNSFLVSALKVKDWINKEEFFKILEKFRVGSNKEEFDEFRLWAVEKGLMRGVEGDLRLSSGILSLYFSGVDYVEKQDFSSEKPVMTQVVQKTLISIIREKLKNIKSCLDPFMNNEYIEEIRLRDTLKIILPDLSNENVSLFINSLMLSIPPSPAVPFRQINISEFFNILDPNSEVKIPPDRKEEPKKPENTQESFRIQESFLVKPRDYNWEKSIIRKVFCVSTPLLANFRLNDWNRSGALTLETFHYTLVKSLEWLTSEEVNFLVELALRECGSIDEARTENIRKNPDRFRVQNSISSVWFPTGEQYNISYMYFLVVLEKLKNE